MQCPACMEQAVPDLASPRVYQSHGAAGAHLSGPNKLFLGYKWAKYEPVLMALADPTAVARQVKTPIS